jgi:hypothetical protein
MKEKSGIALIIGIGGGCGCMRKGCPVCKGENMENKIMAPEGFSLEGMQEGEEKEILAVVRYLGGNELEIVSVDGFPLGESEEDEEEDMEEMEDMEGEEGEEDEESFAQQLSARAGLM